MYNAVMDPIKAMTLRAKHEASHAIYAYHLKCSLPDLTIEDDACTFIERMGFDLHPDLAVKICIGAQVIVPDGDCMDIAQHLALDVSSGMNDLAEALLKGYFAEAQEVLTDVSDKGNGMYTSQLNSLTLRLQQDTDISAIEATFLIENIDS